MPKTNDLTRLREPEKLNSEYRIKSAGPITYQIKNFSSTFKDVDVKSGIVCGYFANFGTIDADKEMFIKGAFKKTIKENGPDGNNRIAHLLQHDIWKPLSKPQVLREDKEGLYFESKISPTSYGKDTMQLYMDGVYTEHSVGFQTMKKEVDNENDCTCITECKLWEGSTVTWGANMNTPFMGFKNQDEINGKIEILTKSIKNGKYTDDTFRQLEIFLAQLKTLLITEEPVPPTSPDVEPLCSEMISLFRTNLKLNN